MEFTYLYFDCFCFKGPCIVAEEKIYFSLWMAKLLSNLFPNNLKLFLKYNLDLLDGNIVKRLKKVSHRKSVDEKL